MSDALKIVLVDDDKLVCASLKTIIESDSSLQVVGIGHNGKEAVALYERFSPDILLMDIRMDTMTGIEAGEIVLKSHPTAKILYLTTFADNEYIVRAFKIGAKGYLLKQNFESIVPSLKAVATGQTVFGEDIVAKLPSLIGSGGKPSLAQYDINEKEYEIISLIAEGLSNKEIAAKLFLSDGTVRNSISVILEKLNLRDRTQLAILYYKSRQGGWD